MKPNQVLFGRCQAVLRGFSSNSFDACVTDPPYGLGPKEPTVEEIISYLLGEELSTGGDFMGKKWSVPSVDDWKEVYRVLKPGAHLFCFGGTRTWDLISIGIRAAGFQLRDTIASEHPALQWIYGQGFPKSLNVSKAIDKEVGAEREVVGTYRVGGNALTPTKLKGGTYVTGAPNSPSGNLEITAAASEDAKKWEGWGTALKPSWEPILVFRKPLESKVIDNVRKYGTGAINIDGCRVHTDWNESDRPDSWKRSGHTNKPEAEKIAAPPGNGIVCHPGGGWPSNLICSHADCHDDKCVLECPIAALDGSSRYFPQFKPDPPFIYSAKVSTKESTLDGRIENKHPTRKPLKLMRWLVKLVTQPCGILLDPFCGSGSTLHAALLEGMNYIGIDNDPKAHKTASDRMKVLHDERRNQSEDS